MGWLIVAPYPFLVVLSLVIAIIAVVEEALHRGSRIFAEQQARPLHHGMGITERDLECHRHLNDLLSCPAVASTHAGGAHPKNIQHVYKYRHDTHRVCGTLVHRRNRSRHYGGPECTAPLCVWLCLERILR